MGCGSSRSTSTSTAVANHTTSQDVSTVRSTSNFCKEQHSSCQAADVDPSPQPHQRNVSVFQSQTLPTLDEQHSHNTLKHIPLVSPFNVKSSFQSPPSDVEGKEASNDNVVTVDDKIHITGITEELLSDSNTLVAPVTSNDYDILTRSPVGQVSVQSRESESNFEKFNRFLKQSCQLTHNERLLETAPFVNNLELDRSFYSFTKSNLLCRVVSVMKHLHTLKLGGGQMGPVAFRFILTSLRYNTTIKHLDLSDNLANPECAAAIGSFLTVNPTVEVLNLSGNRLGKDSLSRHVGSAMLRNCSLKSLDISNCCATDLHCLCESMLNSTSSSLVTLKAADNTISDDRRFVVDISLILESDNCKLEDIDVSNTSVNNSSAVDIIIESISKNTSIRTLRLGKNVISNTKKICMMLVNVCSHPNMTLFSMGKMKVNDPTPCELTEFEVNKEENSFASELRHLDVADCCLGDNLLQNLASQLGNKLSNLVFLDVSKNDIGPAGLNALNQLTNGQLAEVSMMQIKKSDGIVEAIVSKFTKLSRFDFTRTKLSQDDLKILVDHVLQHGTSLSLNGLKLGGLAILSGVFDKRASLHLTDLHLSVCQLTDSDINPLCDILGQTTLSFPLKKLDVSVNRLTSSFVQSLIESLLKHPQHDFQSINASNNAIDGVCLGSFLKLFKSTTHTSNITSVNLSHNDITACSVTHFLSSLTDQVLPLQNLDLSHQNDSFIEGDMEELAKLVKEIFHLQHNLWSDCNFSIDLRGNGGSEISDLSVVDSAAIKTDFVTRRKPELTLRDVMEIMIGIQFPNGGAKIPRSYSISAELWKEVVLKDTPAWTFVNSELSKAAYISHMPSTATRQKIQGMLEMDADCGVKDLFLVKDPITQQSTGTVWVLFQDTESLHQAVSWFYNGNAYIFGIQFSISEIPLCITDESHGAVNAADRDLKLRSIEAKQQIETDKKILEESMQLAAERAEYRELHPAYQGGRIS